MERQMHISGQSLTFERAPDESASGFAGMDKAQVALVQPFTVPIGDGKNWTTEDMDRNRKVAERMALAWNATRDLTTIKLLLMSEALGEEM